MAVVGRSNHTDRAGAKARELGLRDESERAASEIYSATS